MRTRLEIEDLDRVVAKRGNEQTLSGGIERQVIDPPFDAWELNRPYLRQRRLLCEGCLRHHDRRSDQHQNSPHVPLTDPPVAQRRPRRRVRTATPLRVRWRPPVPISG